MSDPGAVAPILQMAPFALILVVFYFLLIRPQQKKARETQEMIDNLKVGDEIVSTGGLYGRILKLADKVIFVEVAPKVQIRLERASVGRVVRGRAEGKGAEEKQA
jgi:preprotein translocase subunit YajC